MCENGSSKPKIILNIEREQESVSQIKEKMFKKLKNEYGSQYSYHKNVRLFRITGIELADFETVDDMQTNDFLFFSFGKKLINYINRGGF